jgi:hypothetical protein
MKDGTFRFPDASYLICAMRLLSETLLEASEASMMKQGYPCFWVGIRLQTQSLWRARNCDKAAESLGSHVVGVCRMRWLVRVEMEGRRSITENQWSRSSSHPQAMLAYTGPTKYRCIMSQTWNSPLWFQLLPYDTNFHPQSLQFACSGWQRDGQILVRWMLDGHLMGGSKQ